jgi:response regulator RpfG family c-di-GMP phosphodiesterase
MNTILFVDDEVRVLDGLRRMLHSKRDEWRCIFAESVDAAVSLIDSESLDAIVSDVTMPGKTGLDLLRFVRNQPSTRYLPVLMLTGNGDIGTKREALSLGATDFLNKPFDFVELTARLQNAIALKKFQDEIRTQNEFLEERVRDRTEELEQSRKDIIFRLAKAAEARDTDTGNHIVRVGLASQLLAKALGLDEATQERMLLTSPLHDVGKIGIEDHILRKPGSLSDDERRRMQEHCRIGAEILTEDLRGFLQRLGENTGDSGENDLLKVAARIALCHHERWDGTGYPNGLRGEEIPIEARIVAVTDVYDALRTKRPYKDEFDSNKALQIMLEGAGTHFDPHVIGTFASIYAEVESALESLRRGDEPLEQAA